MSVPGGIYLQFPHFKTVSDAAHTAYAHPDARINPFGPPHTQTHTWLGLSNRMFFLCGWHHWQLEVSTPSTLPSCLIYSQSTQERTWKMSHSSWILGSKYSAKRRRCISPVMDPTTVPLIFFQELHHYAVDNSSTLLHPLWVLASFCREKRWRSQTLYRLLWDQ